jgi:CDP-paratose 2-epimerase
MTLVVVTGSAGLVGSEAARFFHEMGWDVVGIDNDMRGFFFGAEASTQPNLARLQADLRRYRHVQLDIRDRGGISDLFRSLGRSVAAVVHAAAQPSHDWAARDPQTDFSVNAVGTLNLLEASRQYAPETVFIFMSTNKVYGDAPNRLPLVEGETRFSVAAGHPYEEHGIDERLTVDQSLHSVFGASKLAADVLVQEYGRYFGLSTVCFRAGCLTGPAHAGAQLHGFLAFLVRACACGMPYTVFGYNGKQVRDNLHAADLVRAFWEYVRSPRAGEVYNIGGGSASHCSMLEAIALAEQLVGRSLDWTYQSENRTGDHQWWISDVRKFRDHYPNWRVTRDVPAIIAEMASQVR